MVVKAYDSKNSIKKRYFKLPGLHDITDCDTTSIEIKSQCLKVASGLTVSDSLLTFGKISRIPICLKQIDVQSAKKVFEHLRYFVSKNLY